MIKKISIVALFLLLVGIVGSLTTFRSVNKVDSFSNEKVINQSNYTAIKVETYNSDIEIVPTKEVQTKIEVTGKTRENYKHDLTAEVNGNTLNIKLIDQRKKFFSVNFGSITEYLTLKVYLPEKEYTSLKIKSDNGQILLKQLDVKDVVAHTSNGRIELKKISASNVNVQTNNGRIAFEYVDGNIKGKSNNGKISVVTKDLDRSIELETNNGRIEIETEIEPTNTMFDVYSNNGRINILERYNRNTVIGEGENIIKLTSDNGSISVTKK